MGEESVSGEPETPADWRPGGEPYFIDSECTECGSELEFFDIVDGEAETQEDVEWRDEFVCPNCYDGRGIYMDQPSEHIEELVGRIEESEEWVPAEEVFDDWDPE